MTGNIGCLNVLTLLSSANSQALKLRISYLVTTSLARRNDRRTLASCLEMSSNHAKSPKDVLRFTLRRGYMIVPQSNPPAKIQEKIRRQRSVYTGKCAFQMEVKDFVDTLPRLLTSATCSGCDVRCIYPEGAAQQMQVFLVMGGKRSASGLYSGAIGQKKLPYYFRLLNLLADYFVTVTLMFTLGNLPHEQNCIFIHFCILRLFLFVIF